MRHRPAARLLILDPLGRVLLFHFRHQSGALAGMAYWATPGGGVEDGETFEAAALRELWEDGIRVDHVGPQVAQRQVVFQLADGEYVDEDERYFRICVADDQVNTGGWTSYEVECMTGHRWWTQDELALTAEQVWPHDLGTMLKSLAKVGMQA